MTIGRPPRPPRRALHGVLLLDKPLGWSSQDALRKVKGLLRAEKAGHTGTLDPLATGLLPLCFGAATKFAQIALDADKAYRATLHLGRTTTTGDLEGEVVDQRAAHLDDLRHERRRLRPRLRSGRREHLHVDRAGDRRCVLDAVRRELHPSARADVVQRLARQQ